MAEDAPDAGRQPCRLTDLYTALLARLHFRVEAEEIAHPDGRVLVFYIPSRPIGVPVQLDGVYWMRSGEELVAMPPDQLKRIMEEAEPDFSATICAGATLDDLDPAAIALFRERWIRKSSNQALRAISPTQLLADADLFIANQVTYAALALLGTRQALTRRLARAEVIFEYRSSDVTDPAAQREEFRQGFLPVLDALWNLINLRSNLNYLVDQGVIEPTGGDKFILSRGLYAFLGQKGTYTRKRGLDRETNKALLLKHITDNNAEGSKLDELLQVLPSQSSRQVQYLLQELKAENRIHIKGRTQSARWHAGPEPIEQKTS